MHSERERGGVCIVRGREGRSVHSERERGERSVHSERERGERSVHEATYCRDVSTPIVLRRDTAKLVRPSL